jgi:hypothetical protein
LFASNIGTAGAQIALVYKDGMYHAFLNGTKVCSLGSTFSNGWGGSVDLAGNIGKTGTLKIGLSMYKGTAQFTDWGYSTEAEDIEQYIPSIGVEHYTNAYSSVVDGVATYTASKYGTQTFKGIEIEQGANYVLYATVASGMSAENVGFVVGTNVEANNFMMFQWRRNQKDFFVYRDGKGDWKGHADGLFSSNIGTNGAEIALVYKNGTYYAFLNGTLACQFNSEFDTGWGGTLNVANLIGTEGALPPNSF